MNTKLIKLDINEELLETITAKQGDTKSRFILFNLYDGATPFDLRYRTVRVYGQKKDNTEVFNDLEINDAKNGYCTLELTNQMLAVEGMYELELVIFEGNKRLSTMPFILNVVGSKYSEDAIVSTNEFTALMNALKTVSNIDNKAEKKDVDELSSQLEKDVEELSSQLDNKANKKDYSINIKDCGVKGGIENAINDTKKIKVAIELARSLFKPLYIPKGDYYINEQLDFYNIPIIYGDGISASRVICNSEIEKFIVNINMSRWQLKDIQIDGGGKANYCLDTTFNQYNGPSLNVLYKNVLVRNYKKYGWLADNNNDVWWENVVIIEPKEKSTSLGALHVHGSGGPNQFINCNFLDDVFIGGQYNSFINCVIEGITVNGLGFNIFKIEGSYLFPSTKNKCVFYIPNNCELASVTFSNPHIELYNECYLVGGTGKLHYGLNCIGGHIFNPTEIKGGDIIQSSITHVYTAPTNNFQNVWFNNINLDNFKNGHMLNSFTSCYLDGNKFDTFKVGTYTSAWSEITSDKVEICNTIDGKGILNQLFYLNDVTTEFKKIPLEFDSKGNFLVQVRGVLNDSPFATFLIGQNGGYGATVAKLLDGKGIGDFNEMSFDMEYNQGLKIKIDKTAAWDKVPRVKIAVIGI